MIKAILSVGFFLCLGISYGQQTTKTPAKQVGLERTPPSLTKEMEQYAATNGSYIVAKASGKEIEFDGEVPLEIAQKVNPKDMGIAILDRGQFYKITGTDKMLIVKSTWVLDNEMKTAK